MKFLIFSDSHNKTRNMEAVIKNTKDVDGIIHLGDCVDDVIGLEKRTKGGFLYYVTGNCDFRTTEPDEMVISIHGYTIFLTHGHFYGAKSNPDAMIYAALEKEADICLFGHTHSPYRAVEKDILILNPGSISLPRGNNHPSYGIMNIDKNEVTTSIWVIADGLFRPARNY